MGLVPPVVVVVAVVAMRGSVDVPSTVVILWSPVLTATSTRNVLD